MAGVMMMPPLRCNSQFVATPSTCELKDVAHSI
jgi:hypothetical protein